MNGIRELLDLVIQDCLVHWRGSDYNHMVQMKRQKVMSLISQIWSTVIIAIPSSLSWLAVLLASIRDTRLEGLSLITCQLILSLLFQEIFQIHFSLPKPPVRGPSLMAPFCLHRDTEGLSISFTILVGESRAVLQSWVLNLCSPMLSPGR